MKKIKANPLIEWLVWRIKRQKNAIIAIVGPTGSSKSYDAITLAYSVAKRFDTHFTIADNLDFKFEGLIKKTMLPENSKPGTPFIFEEVGSIVSGASSREWQSKLNKFFFSFMQTTRHRQQILIFTTPHFAFLDKGVRNLCHLLIETQKIDFSKRLAYVKVYTLQTNMKSGKTYYKFLRFINHGEKGKLKYLAIAYPPDDLVKDYEKVKTEYTTELNQSIINRSEGNKATGAPRQINYVNVDRLLNEKTHTNQEVADLCKCSLASVKNRKKLLKEMKKL